MDESPSTAPETPEAPPPARAPRPQPTRTPSPHDTYYYDGATETYHPVLGMIHVGANSWPDATPEQAEVIAAMATKGILRHG